MKDHLYYNTLDTIKKGFRYTLHHLMCKDIFSLLVKTKTKYTIYILNIRHIRIRLICPACKSVERPKIVKLQFTEVKHVFFAKI